MDKTVKVFYLRDEHNRPVMCVASKPDGDNVKFATAICNLKDSASRQAGRKIALQRLEFKAVPRDDKPPRTSRFVRTVRGGENTGLRILESLIEQPLVVHEPQRSTYLRDLVAAKYYAMLTEIELRKQQQAG
jgi:hypothetical protein